MKANVNKVVLSSRTNTNDISKDESVLIEKELVRIN
jgi:hypothetical protein